MQPLAILTPVRPPQEHHEPTRAAQTPGGPFVDPGHELRRVSPPVRAAAASAPDPPSILSPVSTTQFAFTLLH